MYKLLKYNCYTQNYYQIINPKVLTIINYNYIYRMKQKINQLEYKIYISHAEDQYLTPNLKI